MEREEMLLLVHLLQLTCITGVIPSVLRLGGSKNGILLFCLFCLWNARFNVAQLASTVSLPLSPTPYLAFLLKQSGPQRSLGHFFITSSHLLRRHLAFNPNPTGTIPHRAGPRRARVRSSCFANDPIVNQLIPAFPCRLLYLYSDPLRLALSDLGLVSSRLALASARARPSVRPGASLV